MPISSKDMREKGAPVESIQNAKRQEAVAAFLKEHKGQAYTQTEVAKEFAMKPQQARQIMMSLLKKGQVDRKAFGEGAEQRIYFGWVVPAKQN
jgi:predicted ArsR family transcriptional regulator